MAKKKVSLPSPSSPSAADIVRASMAPPAPVTGEASTAGGTVQTSRGYVTREGVEKVRVSLHLTKAQRRRLKELADDAGESVSDYIARSLAL